MDDYKQYYYSARPSARGRDMGRYAAALYLCSKKKQPLRYLICSIEGRLALRKRLNCTTFDWYMKTVYPELKLDYSSVL